MNPVIILIWVACTFLAVITLSYVIVRISIYPPRFSASQTPDNLGLNGERVEFQSLDGLKIRGWWIAGDSDTTIILCHGHAMSHGMMLKYAPFLHSAGFNVMVFDFRGRGESCGDGTTVGFHEVADLMGAVRFAKDKSKGRIGVFGVSMGGAVAIRAAAACRDIHAVATEAAYARLTWAMLNYLIFFSGPIGLVLFPFVYYFGQRLAGFRAKLAAPVEFVAQISPRPLLLVHSTWDALILPFHARKLYDAAREPKELWLVPRAWHGSAYRVAPQEFERRITAFFRSALKEQPNAIIGSP